MSNHTKAPSREQVAKWAQEVGFTVRNEIIKTVHSNGSWVAINERLAEFAALAYAAGQVAQAKRKPPPTMVIDNPDVVALVTAAVRTEREACAAMLDQLEQQRDELLAALEKATAVFRAYSELHDSKGATEKAISNMQHAMSCEEAIASVKGGVA